MIARAIAQFWLAATSCALASACAADTSSQANGAYPFAGLYTPGNTLGASDPTDTPEPSTLGDRCTPATDVGDHAGVAQSSGTLRVEYRTQPTGGDYAPKNCSAVWVEDATGRYIATLDLRARLRRPSLAYFRERACAAQLGPDVMTSATTLDHSELHMATWSGRNFSQRVVPDGVYKLYIESTETDRAPGQFEVFDIQKGAQPYAMRLLVSEDGPVSEVRLSWKPGSGAPGAN